MQTQIQMHHRTIEVTLSSAAEEALSQRDMPLLAEMELYFSCLIRKVVRFHETTTDDSIAINEKLSLRFRPIMTQHCGTDYEGTEPPVTDFPITEPERYVPHWLKIDYKGGQWYGEFGYAR
jgi:hypothetical protein